MENDPVRLFLQHKLGNDEGDKTFKRWYQWLTEVFHEPTEADMQEVFRAIEESDYDELITIRNIDVDLTCPHHILPMPMIVHVGYLPSGQILGLSKFARAARLISSAKTQEEYTIRLADLLKERLKAHWVIVMAVAEHSCMRCRGVRSKFADVVTTAIAYNDNKATALSRSLKDEFFRTIQVSKIP